MAIKYFICFLQCFQIGLLPFCLGHILFCDGVHILFSVLIWTLFLHLCGLSFLDLYELAFLIPCGLGFLFWHVAILVSQHFSKWVNYMVFCILYYKHNSLNFSLFFRGFLHVWLFFTVTSSYVPVFPSLAFVLTAAIFVVATYAFITLM